MFPSARSWIRKGTREVQDVQEAPNDTGLDRNETELRNLRATVDMLDGGLRRFAAGDVRTTFENPFPLHFEGLRRDFNRGIGAVSRAADAVIDTSRA